MDLVSVSLFTKLVEYGPGFAVAVFMFIVWFMERKRNNELVDRLLKLSIASLKADHENNKMYGSVSKTLSVIVDAIKSETR